MIKEIPDAEKEIQELQEKRAQAISKVDPKRIQDLKARVLQYDLMKLPGQPMATHMGTSYLVHSLWRMIQELTGGK